VLSCLQDLSKHSLDSQVRGNGSIGIDKFKARFELFKPLSKVASQQGW